MSVRGATAKRQPVTPASGTRYGGVGKLSQGDEDEGEGEGKGQRETARVSFRGRVYV